jgi:hypothetical protein
MDASKKREENGHRNKAKGQRQMMRPKEEARFHFMFGDVCMKEQKNDENVLLQLEIMAGIAEFWTLWLTPNYKASSLILQRKRSSGWHAEVIDF